MHVNNGGSHLLAKQKFKNLDVTLLSLHLTKNSNSSSAFHKQKSIFFQIFTVL